MNIGPPSVNATLDSVAMLVVRTVGAKGRIDAFVMPSRDRGFPRSAFDGLAIIDPSAGG